MMNCRIVLFADEYKTSKRVKKSRGYRDYLTLGIREV